MSNGHRWSKFWWQDWQTDAALRMCGLAAQGLWMRLLCLAHEGAPVGHVTVNDKAPTNRQLALIIGATEKEIGKLLGELEEAGVFSRTTDGIIYSRRMVRDVVASEAGREFGKEGGNPSLNGKEKPPEKRQGGLTPPLNPSPYPGALTEGLKGGAYPGALTGGVNLQEAEAHSRAEEEPEESVQVSDYKHLYEGPVSAPGRAREAAAAADPLSEDADVPTLNEIMELRRKFSEAPSPLVEGITSLASAMRMEAYPPREPLRTRNDQVDIVGEVRRPKPHHLTREQINRQLQMTRRRQ